MKWISVKDELPSDKTECLGFFERPYKDGFTVNEVWYNNKRWYWDFYSIENITHWMPLPEPPKTINK